MKKAKRDRFLLEEIQPRGGITFRHESYVLTGSGYQTCLHVIEYPQKLRRHWLAELCNIDNTITVVDVSTIDTNEVKRNLSRSMEEQDLRYQMSDHPSDKTEAKMRYMELKTLLEELSQMKEVMKQIHTRIYVAAKTKEELEKKVKAVFTELDTSGYRTAILLNESEREWKSMFIPYRKQHKDSFMVEGQPLTSRTLAGGIPFNFSALEDKYGSFLGLTSTGGNFLFDLFWSDDMRRHYNAVIAGLMGSGKSTILKKFFKDRAMRGDYVRAFDVTGEFTALTYEFGGKVLRIDGSQGMINPLEIFKADENESNNYSIHMSKQTAFYRILKPEATIEEVNKYQETLDELYSSFGLSPVKDGKENKITGLPVDQYPRFSDFLGFLEKKIEEKTQGTYTSVEEQVMVYEILLLKKVKDTISTNVSIYGHVLDGYTSIKLEDEQIATFNISGLKEMATNIYQALLYILLLFCYNEGVINGSIMKKKYENGMIGFEDLTRFLVIVDEAPRILNTNYLQALEIIKQIMREGRKYFISIMLAAQSIRNFFPSLNKEDVSALSDIFELSQYKITFQQDESAMDVIDNVYGGNLSEIQKSKIPRLPRGQCFFTISGVATYQVDIYASKEELALFQGGV